MVFTANIKLSKLMNIFSLYVFSSVVAAKLGLELVIIVKMIISRHHPYLQT